MSLRLLLPNELPRGHRGAVDVSDKHASALARALAPGAASRSYFDPEARRAELSIPLIRKLENSEPMSAFGTKQTFRD